MSSAPLQPASSFIRQSSSIALAAPPPSVDDALSMEQDPILMHQMRDRAIMMALTTFKLPNSNMYINPKARRDYELEEKRKAEKMLRASSSDPSDDKNDGYDSIQDLEKGIPLPNEGDDTQLQEEEDSKKLAQLQEAKKQPILSAALVKEIVRYVAMLVLFAVVVNLRSHTSAFYLQKSFHTTLAQEQFSNHNVSFTYSSIGNVGDTLDWLNYVVTPALVPPIQWYNGDIKNTTDANFINGFNLMMGTMRIRQIRVKRGSCQYVPSSLNVYAANGCYPAYSADVEDKSDFLGNGNAATPYVWRSGVELGSTLNTDGDYATYGSSGYAVDINCTSVESATNGIASLISNRFLDYGTRAVFLDVSLYNPTLQLFLTARYFIELIPTGGAIAKYELRMPTFFRYNTLSDMLLLGAELGLVAMFLQYFVLELQEAFACSPSYWKSFWNYVEWASLLLFFGVICVRLSLAAKVSRLGNLAKVPMDKHVSTYDASFLSSQEMNVLATCGFLMWIKLLRYVQVLPRMGTLTRTLEHAARPMSFFLFMFFLLFLGFAQAFYLSLGKELEAFSTFGRCIGTLYVGFLAGLDYPSLSMANRFLGPLLYFFFTTLMKLLLFTFFVAVMEEAFVVTQIEMKAKYSDDELVREIAQYFANRWQQQIEALEIKKARIGEVARAVLEADQNDDGQLDPDEMQLLAETFDDDPNFETEIAKFDIDQDGSLNTDEFNLLMQHLEREFEKLEELESELKEEHAFALAQQQELGGEGEADGSEENQATKAEADEESGIIEPEKKEEDDDGEKKGKNAKEEDKSGEPLISARMIASISASNPYDLNSDVVASRDMQPLPSARALQNSYREAEKKKVATMIGKQDMISLLTQIMQERCDRMEMILKRRLMAQANARNRQEEELEKRQVEREEAEDALSMLPSHRLPRPMIEVVEQAPLTSRVRFEAQPSDPESSASGVSSAISPLNSARKRRSAHAAGSYNDEDAVVPPLDLAVASLTPISESPAASPSFSKQGFESLSLSARKRSSPTHSMTPRSPHASAMSSLPSLSSQPLPNFIDEDDTPPLQQDDGGEDDFSSKSKLD